MIDLSKYSEEHIDSIILDYYNEWCILPEWTKDIKYDFLILPPKIAWYLESYNRDINHNNLLCALRARRDINDFPYCMRENSIVYDKYFRDTLYDVVFRIAFFRVGLLNTSIGRYVSLEDSIRGTIRHEWRHILQDLYIMKMECRTHGNKSVNIRGSYMYSSPEQIFEEDAREVQYVNPNKPIEEFYKEYKRMEYVYTKRQGRRGINTVDLVLED